MSSEENKYHIRFYPLGRENPAEMTSSYDTIEEAEDYCKRNMIFLKDVDICKILVVKRLNTKDMEN